MNILGLSGFAHESSVALLKDGNICALVEEERLNREKHTCKFPSLAIAQCLDIGGLSFDDIDYVTFFWDPRLEVLGNLEHVFRFFPRSLGLL
jgi:carbamoyltransferase